MICIWASHNGGFVVAVLSSEVVGMWAYLLPQHMGSSQCKDRGASCIARKDAAIRPAREAPVHICTQAHTYTCTHDGKKAPSIQPEVSTTAQRGAAALRTYMALLEALFNIRASGGIWERKVQVAAAATAVASERTGAEDSSMKADPRGPVV